MIKSDNFVNLHGLAHHLNLPAHWLRSQADAGHIPCIKVGNKYRFNVDAVKMALARMAKKGGGDAE